LQSFLKKVIRLFGIKKDLPFLEGFISFFVVCEKFYFKQPLWSTLQYRFHAGFTLLHNPANGVVKALREPCLDNAV